MIAKCEWMIFEKFAFGTKKHVNPELAKNGFGDENGKSGWMTILFSKKLISAHLLFE
jgi:hypothetical protein